jgi:hypothetical protein
MEHSRDPKRFTAEVLRLVKGSADDANTDNSIDALEGPIEA